MWKSQYDKDTITWNPQGKIFQVLFNQIDYAM